jgi:DNA-binding beta-propeller fold protein YncE
MLRDGSSQERVKMSRNQSAFILKSAICLCGIVLFGVLIAKISAQSGELLVQQHAVELPGYTGDFDHFAVDRQRGRLLLAAEDHGTLEVFDLQSGNHLRTITGFDNPHSILVRAGAPTILVTDSGKSMSKLLDAENYERKGTVTLMPGADSIGYDPAENLVYIVTGGKDVNMKTVELAAVDPDTGQKKRALTFEDDHVEAMAIEKDGNRLFINLTQTNKLAVVDRKTMKVLALWLVPPAQQNAMVALDAAHHRLYLGCRKPGMIVTMNSDTGAVTGTAEGPLRSDELLFDSASHRLYMPGGEGYIGVYDTTDPDHLKIISKPPTAPGAKTGILLPDMKKIMLAASPGDTKAIAKVLTLSIR